jgi:hypothetical protein
LGFGSDVNHNGAVLDRAQRFIGAYSIQVLRCIRQQLLDIGSVR